MQAIYTDSLTMVYLLLTHGARIDIEDVRLLLYYYDIKKNESLILTLLVSIR